MTKHFVDINHLWQHIVLHGATSTSIYWTMVHAAATDSCWWTHPEHQSPFCTAIQIWVGARNNVSCNDLVTNNQRSNYPSLSVKDHLPPPTPIIISPSSQTGYHHIVSHNFGNIHQHHQTHIDNTHKYYINRVNFKVPNCMGNEKNWWDFLNAVFSFGHTYHLMRPSRTNY